MSASSVSLLPTRPLWIRVSDMKNLPKECHKVRYPMFYSVKRARQIGGDHFAHQVARERCAFLEGWEKDGYMVHCGCQTLTLNDFAKAVKVKHKNNHHAKVYLAQIKVMELIAKESEAAFKAHPGNGEGGGR